MYRGGRTNAKGGGGAILVSLQYETEVMPVIETSLQSSNEQLIIAIKLSNGKRLYVSTIYCPDAKPSREIIRGLTTDREHTIITGDFDSKHWALGNTEGQRIGKGPSYSNRREQPQPTE